MSGPWSDGIEAFLGEWMLVRAIADERGGAAGRLRGLARFEPGEGGLLYSEEGWLRFGSGPPVRAERRYRWETAPDGTVRVCFVDGRPFHQFAPAPEAEAEHRCEEDCYRVRYDFTAWPDWRAEWRVIGPAKDYRMVSRYRRAGLRAADREERQGGMPPEADGGPGARPLQGGRG